MRLNLARLVPLALVSTALSVTGCGDDAAPTSDTATQSDTSGPLPDATTDTADPADGTPGDLSDGADATPPADTTPDAAPDTAAEVSPDATIDPSILEGDSILGFASRAGNFETFLAAVLRRNLVDNLATGEFTVFAPTDAAFTAYLDATGLSAEQLLASPQLDTLLRYHVVAGKLDGAAIAAAPKQASLIEVALYFDTSDGVRVNVIEGAAAATVSVAETPADNGFLHPIDAVLTPPDLVAVGKLEGLSGFPVSLEAANLEGLDAEGAQHTVFAPTNDAFFNVLRARGQTAVEFLADPEMPGILQYRMVDGRYLLADLLALDGTWLPSLLRQTPAAPAEAYFSPITVMRSGETVRANDQPVTTPDIIAVNGVIHIVGEGMGLPTSLRDRMEGVSMNTFLSALDTQGLTGTLVAPEGPVTVFGMVNIVFGDFPPGDVVGGFHIVPGIVLPADLARAAGTGLQTISGATLPVAIDGLGNIRVGGSRTAAVEMPLIPASNGILYSLSGPMEP